MKLVPLVFMAALLRTVPADAESGVALSMLTEGKKVIPILLEYRNLTVTDIKLPDVVVTNGSPEPITPLGIEVIGTLKGEEIARFQVGPGVVRALIEQVNPQIRRIGPEEEARESLAIAIGKTNLDPAKLSDGLPIKAGQQGLILLSKVLFFHCVGPETVDSLKIVLGLDRGTERESVELAVPLTKWKTGVKYRSPLRGGVLVTCMPLNYLQHRQAQSQEFAIDLLDVRRDRNGALNTSSKPGSGELAAYYIYGRDVLAVADGTVVQTSDAFPESETVNPAKWSEEAYAAVMKRLSGKLAFRDILGGNQVVIQHTQDEFSFYGHLKQQSLKVKVGDKVKAGQPIAQVGSTGHSTEPHLHFQLMDSADFLTANGLPIMFQDVPASSMVENFTGANTLACSDYLYVVVGEK